MILQIHQEEHNKTMKALRSILLSVIFSFCICCPVALAAGSGAPDTSAQGAVLMEAGTYRVLYEKNAHKQLPMASTTKVMTAILAIENGDLSSTVTVSKNASGIEGSSIWLEVGEKMTLEDMLYGLMLSSGNDAAVAIAEHIGGSVEGFVQMMNEKAEEIGAHNTHFMNPNGLSVDGHYTTAYDLALISCYGMNNPTFRQIVGTETREIPWEGHEYNRFLRNKNKILWQYEGGNGVKTGFTKAAGRCLSAGAERDGMQLVATVLNAPDMFEDCKAMLDYGFANYRNYSIIDKTQDQMSASVLNGRASQVLLAPKEDISLPLTEEEYNIIEKNFYYTKEIDAPVLKGQELGKAEVWVGENKMAETPICAVEDVLENTYSYNLKLILEDWLRSGAS